MRIASTATGTSLDAAFDPKFGRCQYFLFIETGDASETEDAAGTGDLSVECVPNPHRASSGGTGTRCAQLMADRQVRMVLTGEVGPNARRALEAARITVVTGCTGSIAEAVAGVCAASPAGSPPAGGE
jgi:predicted Fe-Mo cluster-binding NifX family protein